MLVLGCGDPLVEGDYRGEPLIEIEGTINVAADSELTSSEQDMVRVGLLWVGAAEQADVQGSAESSFPARYRMKLFARPPDRAMVQLPDRDGLYGTARIVLYIDADGDEQLDALERVVGASTDKVLTYFTASEPTSLVRGDVLTGYQVMNVFGCDERLTDKATFGDDASATAVDLSLSAGAAESLLDLDCDDVSDDLCYDLRLQVQRDPENTELVALYEDRCDVEFEPEFNNDQSNTGDEPDERTNNEDKPASNEPEQSCDENPDQPKCEDDPDPDPTPEQVVASCQPLLGGAVGEGFDGQRDAYWRFAQCTEEFDPCGELDWNGTAEGWQQYQGCIFEALPQHHEQWCRDVFDRLEAAEGDDRTFLEGEVERGGCEEVV